MWLGEGGDVVVCHSKLSEVQFYLDRSKDALLAVLRSVLTNPRLSDDDRVQLLRMLSEHHHQIHELLDGKIQQGERNGIELARQAGLKV